MLKVTVSGDYRTAGGVSGEVVDFDNVVGIIPECGEEFIMSHVQNRFLGAWVKADKRYTKRFGSRRTTNIDSIEKVEGTPLCDGKDIKKMGWEELQHLAVAKNLLRIPVTHTADLKAAREIAYIEYSSKILNITIDVKKAGYDFSSLPELIVSEKGVATVEKKPGLEEQLNEAENSDGEISLKDLKEMAKARNIKVPAGIRKADLEKLLFQSEGKQ